MEIIDWTSFLIFCIILLITILWYRKPRSDIPGPYSWPILGNLFLFNEFNSCENKPEFLEKNFAKYGPLFRMFLGPYQIVFVSGFDLVSEMLHRKEFINRPNWLPGIKAVRKVTGGVGLVNADGKEWQERRRFCIKSMKDFGMGKSSIEERILEEITNITESLEKQQGEPITNIRKSMTYASLNIIHGIIFGFRYKHEEEALETLIRYIDTIFNGPTMLSARGVYPILALLSRNELKERINGFLGVKSYIDNQISKHRQSFDRNNIRDFVELYLEAEQNQSEDKAVLDSCRKQNNRLSDRNQLPYVEATLMEIQRVSNIAPSSLPHVSVCDTTLGGYNIPKQTILVADLISVHKDRSVWSNPDEFNPERFLNENNEVVKDEHWIPFSVGPRVCLGESLAKSELFLIFANLIQRFKFSKVDQDDQLSFEGKTGITRCPYPYRVIAKQR